MSLDQVIVQMEEEIASIRTSYDEGGLYNAEYDKIDVSPSFIDEDDGSRSQIDNAIFETLKHYVALLKNVDR